MPKPNTPPPPASARQLIRAAVAAAGKSPRVAKELGIGTSAVSRWIERGTLPSEHIHRLCLMGGNAIRPEQIVEAIGREAEVQA